MNWLKKLEAVEFGSPGRPDAVPTKDALRLIREARADALLRAARYCANSTVKKNPTAFNGLAGLRWHEFNGATRAAIHGAAQVLSAKIRNMAEEEKP